MILCCRCRSVTCCRQEGRRQVRRRSAVIGWRDSGFAQARATPSRRLCGQPREPFSTAAASGSRAKFMALRRASSLKSTATVHDPGITPEMVPSDVLPDRVLDGEAGGMLDHAPRPRMPAFRSMNPENTIAVMAAPIMPACSNRWRLCPNDECRRALGMQSAQAPGRSQAARRLDRFSGQSRTRRGGRCDTPVPSRRRCGAHSH
jgi:hypothetical protein